MSPVCFTSPPLFGRVHRRSVLLFLSKNSDLRRSCSSYCRLQISCGTHCHLFNGQQAVIQIPVYLNLYGSLSKLEVTRLTGQRVWTVEQRAKCHTIPCQKPFLAVIMRFVLSNEPWWSVESIKALSLLICAFCSLYYPGVHH